MSVELSPPVEVGNTPVVRLDDYSTEKLEVFAKLEFMNPFGSLKDRPALWLLRDALERQKASGTRKVIVEPTSGNTGIALAGLGKKLGLKVSIVIPEAASPRTKEIIRSLGAELLETPDDLCPRVSPGADQAISLANSLVSSQPERYHMPNQYENDANFMSHYSTTGPEIWSQTGGRITHFVAGVGTGGTLTGVGSYLKERKEDVRIIAVQPEKRHRIQGLRNLEASAMPALLERRANLIDEWLTVSDKDAFAEVTRVARSADILVGPSSGAVLAGLRRLSLRSGVVTVVFGDDGSKYKELYRELGILGEPELDRLLARGLGRAHAV